MPNGEILTIPVDNETTVDYLLSNLAQHCQLPQKLIVLTLNSRLLLPMMTTQKLKYELLTAIFCDQFATERDREKISKLKIPRHASLPRQPKPVYRREPPYSNPTQQPQQRGWRPLPQNNNSAPVRRAPIERGSLRHVMCNIEGVDMVMLVDTGAQTSLMSLNQAEAANVLHLLDDRVEVRISGVTGHSEVCLGVIHEINVMVNGVQTTSRFIVQSTKHDTGILGADWIEHNHVTIDMASNCLIINGKTVPLIRD